MSHVSTLTLHRHALDELDEAQAAEVHAHLASCERCASRLAVMQAEAAGFDEALPPALQGLQPPVEASTPSPTPAHWLRLLRRLGPALAAAAAAVLLVLALPSTGPDDDGTRTRGELPLLEVWIDAPAGARPLRAAESLAPGDRVQLLYDAQGAARVGLAGRDGTDAIEVYGVVRPPGPGLHPAPFGLALDDAPGPQEFFVVPGDDALDEATVRARVLADHPSVRSVRLSKVDER
jgi:hypothetical protein